MSFECFEYEDGGKDGVIKKPWMEDEDEKLKSLIITHGTGNWSNVAVFLPGRTGKQCRERWHNHLNPGIVKGVWTIEEDELILAMQKLHGNQWAKITKMLPGRTDNAVKNRFHATERHRNRLIRKQLKLQNQKQNSRDGKYVIQNKNTNNNSNVFHNNNTVNKNMNVPSRSITTSFDSCDGTNTTGKTSAMDDEYDNDDDCDDGKDEEVNNDNHNHHNDDDNVVVIYDNMYDSVPATISNINNNNTTSTTTSTMNTEIINTLPIKRRHYYPHSQSYHSELSSLDEKSIIVMENNNVSIRYNNNDDDGTNIDDNNHNYIDMLRIATTDIATNNSTADISSSTTTATAAIRISHSTTPRQLKHNNKSQTQLSKQSSPKSFISPSSSLKKSRKSTTTNTANGEQNHSSINNNLDNLMFGTADVVDTTINNSHCFTNLNDLIIMPSSVAPAVTTVASTSKNTITTNPVKPTTSTATASSSSSSSAAAFYQLLVPIIDRFPSPDFLTTSFNYQHQNNKAAHSTQVPSSSILSHLHPSPCHHHHSSSSYNQNRIICEEDYNGENFHHLSLLQQQQQVHAHDDDNDAQQLLHLSASVSRFASPDYTTTTSTANATTTISDDNNCHSTNNINIDDNNHGCMSTGCILDSPCTTNATTITATSNIDHHVSKNSSSNKSFTFSHAENVYDNNRVTRDANSNSMHCHWFNNNDNNNSSNNNHADGCGDVHVKIMTFKSSDDEKEDDSMYMTVHTDITDNSSSIDNITYNPIAATSFYPTSMNNHHKISSEIKGTTDHHHHDNNNMSIAVDEIMRFHDDDNDGNTTNQNERMNNNYNYFYNNSSHQNYYGYESLMANHTNATPPIPTHASTTETIPPIIQTQQQSLIPTTATIQMPLIMPVNYSSVNNSSNHGYSYSNFLSTNPTHYATAASLNDRSITMNNTYNHIML